MSSTTSSSTPNLQLKPGRPPKRKSSDNQAEKKKREPPHKWEFREDVALVNAVHSVGQNNRWTVIHNNLGAQLKWKSPKPDAIMRRWKLLCDKNKSPFWQAYVPLPKPVAPKGATSNAIKAMESAWGDLDASNRVQYQQCRKFIEEITSREQLLATDSTHTEAELQKKHLDHERVQREVRRNRFEELVGKSDREDKDRASSLKMIYSASNQSLLMEKIQGTFAYQQLLASMMKSCVLLEMGKEDPFVCQLFSAARACTFRMEDFVVNKLYVLEDVSSTSSNPLATETHQNEPTKEPSGININDVLEVDSASDSDSDSDSEYDFEPNIDATNLNIASDDIDLAGELNVNSNTTKAT